MADFEPANLRFGVPRGGDFRLGIFRWSMVIAGFEPAGLRFGALRAVLIFDRALSGSPCVIAGFRPAGL